jgi:transposase
MWHIGVDLHRKTVVIAAVHDSGEVRPPVRWETSQTDEIQQTFRDFGEFRAVVEATGTYRWFYKLIAPLAAYAGLTARVHQSGDHCYRGHISKQSSPWLRWILVEGAMKLVHKDVALANFYQRIRKRSSTKIARVATARKLAEICWKRLLRWQRQHAEKTVAA